MEFATLDVETANTSRASVCAFGVTLVRDGKVVSSDGWLCRPPDGLDHFDDRNISVHGIHPGDVAKAPSFAESVDRFLGATEGLPVFAHNASFDIGAVRDGCSESGLTWAEY